MFEQICLIIGGIVFLIFLLCSIVAIIWAIAKIVVLIRDLITETYNAYKERKYDIRRKHRNDIIELFECGDYSYEYDEFKKVSFKFVNNTKYKNIPSLLFVDLRHYIVSFSEDIFGNEKKYKEFDNFDEMYKFLKENKDDIVEFMRMINEMRDKVNKCFQKQMETIDI